MTYGLIITAGKQSRFNSDVPKALMPYGNSTLLDINIANMSTVCDSVIVVCSYENYKWFKDYHHIKIESGRGCGDAVLQALTIIKPNDNDTVFIQWGDCLHTSTIYKMLKDNYTFDCLIPCVYEESPYVQIIPCESNQVKVLFSKYGDSISPGWHDLSLFYGHAKSILHHLSLFEIMITVDGKYVHPHNNEMQFLDVFNETGIRGQIIEVPDYQSFSFNTVEEFNSIMEARIMR